MLRIRSLAIWGMLSGCSVAFTSDGYFPIGYGIKSQGMGGVGIALPQDGLAAAINPAGMAFVPDRADVGLTWFAPDRSAQITGNFMSVELHQPDEQSTGRLLRLTYLLIFKYGE